MAGDWIKLEHVTADKPEVISIAGILDIDQDAVTGKLIRLWIWADQQTIDGNAKGNAARVTKTFIDRCACVAGFADAMLSVGWLVVDEGGGFSFPNFDRHNGTTAKARALASKRQAKFKENGNAKGNATRVTPALPEKRREEKRREEENTKTPLPPEGGKAAELDGEADFILAWNSADGCTHTSSSTLTEKRRKALRARLAEKPPWDWRGALAKFPLKFLEPGGWKPDLDWFLKPGKVSDILTGKYDWRKSNGPNADRSQRGATFDPENPGRGAAF